MSKIIIKLYETLPNSFIKNIGKNKSLKKIRDYFLKKNGDYKIVKTQINRNYSNFHVSFNFYATVKTAVKAKNHGIENSLLSNSIKLLSDYNLTKKPVIFDIGASYGYLSLVWGKSILANGGLLYSFEPGLSVSKTTEKNFRENNLLSIIKFHNKAVGNKNEVVEIFDAGNHSNVIKSKTNTKPFLVDMVSIDQFILNENIEKVDLIKIDVDGIEFNILKGAENTIRKFNPILIIEPNNESRIIEFCLDLGYKILDQKLIPYEFGQQIPANIFCVHKNKLS